MWAGYGEGVDEGVSGEAAEGVAASEGEISKAEEGDEEEDAEGDVDAGFVDVVENDRAFVIDGKWNGQFLGHCRLAFGVVHEERSVPKDSLHV